jgi:hypothetical protein
LTVWMLASFRMGVFLRNGAVLRTPGRCHWFSGGWPESGYPLPASLSRSSADWLSPQPPRRWRHGKAKVSTSWDEPLFGTDSPFR